MKDEENDQLKQKILAFIILLIRDDVWIRIRPSFAGRKFYSRFQKIIVGLNKLKMNSLFKSEIFKILF